MEVEQFYDNISNKYTDLLSRVAPRYQEMLWTILHYVPDGLDPNKIVDLGCGTGNLSEAVLKCFPKAKLAVVDVSAEILEECKERLQPFSNVKYFQKDFRELEFIEGSLDLVVSSIAIHHLTDGDKLELFTKIKKWLSPKGVLIFGDQFSGKTEEVYLKHMANWKRMAAGMGTNPEEWELWMQHQDDHDFHAPVDEHIDWLKQAGFTQIDVLWRYLLWTVVQAS